MSGEEHAASEPRSLPPALKRDFDGSSSGYEDASQAIEDGKQKRNQIDIYLPILANMVQEMIKHRARKGRFQMFNIHKVLYLAIQF